MGTRDSKPRSRITLSCAPCKRRKVKCDRKLPCSSCIKHNVPDQCGYFGDQVLASASTSPSGVSVFRAFADEQENTGEIADSQSSFAIGQNRGPLWDTEASNRHLPANKRAHVEPAFAGPGRQQMAEELSRLKTKLRHLESSMDRRPSANGAQTENLMYQNGPAAPATYLPPVPGAFPPPPPPPAMPMPQMAPMYLNNGAFPALNQAPGFMSANNGHLSASPRGFYPSSNSPHLNLFYNRLGTPTSVQNSGPDLRSFSISQYSPGPASLGPKLVPIPSSGPGPTDPNMVNPVPVPASGQGPLLQPISAAYNNGDYSLPAPQIPAQNLEVQNSWIGINPCDSSDPDEIFDLYSGYNPIHSGKEGRNTNHGPFSYYSYVQKDPLLSSLWDFMRMPEEKTQKSMIASLHEPEEDSSNNKDAILNHKIKVELNKRTISLGLTVFEGEVDSNMHLLGRIKLMLPTQKTVSVLVDRFFKYVYPYYPILDEKHFRTQVKRILGGFCQREEKYTEIRCTKREDTAILGILLIVLRISYLSALSNRRCENERVLSSHGSPKLEETKYILTHPINIDVVPVARLCLDQYDLYQRANLTVLQCAVLLRIYFSIAPEQGDSADGYESNVFNVICIQTAYCMGLNRDPKKIYGHSTDSLRDSLSKKLWYFIKFMDLKISLQFGFPLMVDESYNDIEITENVNDGREDGENKVNDTIGLMAELYGKMRVILKNCISIRSPMKVLEITDALSKFEVDTQATLGTLSTLLRSNEYSSQNMYAKVLHTKTYLNIRFFTLSIFYHLFLNYEKSKKHDLAFFYLRKFISVTCGEILVDLLNMIKNSELFAPESVVSGLILNPPIVFMIHKSNQLNLRVLNMLNYMISKMENEGEIHERNLLTSSSYKQNHSRVVKLAKSLENINKFNNSCLSMLGHRFLYAWRVSKIHTFLLEIATSESFRKKQFETGMNPIPMTPQRVKDLLDITEASYSKMKSAFHKGDNVSKNSISAGAKLEQENSSPYKDLVKKNIEVNDPSLKQPQSSSMEYGSQFGEARDSTVSENFQGHSSDNSTSSTSAFDFGGFELGNTAEIDSLWQQINNYKNINKYDNEDNWGDVIAENEELIDNGGEWYQRIVTNVPSNDGYSSVKGNAPLNVYSDL